LRGPEAYVHFTARLQSPFLIAFNLLAFCFVVFHTITWFNAAPRAMPVRMGGKRVPELLVTLPNYAMLFVVSGFVAWLLLRTS
jgi:fumarate reductase subunit C